MKVEQTKVLDNYSAGSGMVSLDGKLYLMGDDMGYMLVMDTAFNTLGTITILDTVTSPMPKPVKPDVEAVAIVQNNGENALLLIGSGSFDYHRDRGWLVNTRTKEKTEINLQPFYNRLRALGLKNLNIEGCVTTGTDIVLSARGDKATPINHLVFTSANFWSDQANAPITIKTVSTGGGNKRAFSGVSGLEYSKQTDCLILSISTEDTKNAYDDGTIGTSYLWFVHNFSQKAHDDVIIPDRIIDLVQADSRFKRQKIESVCIMQQDAHHMVLALAADNDDGKTALFKVTLDN